MDNLTHTLVGAALAESGLKRYSPLATPTLLIAANSPDIDIISWAFGPAAYLEWHRGITHALVGFPVVALALAGSISLYARFAGKQARFWPLFFLSLIGTATHPLLDFTNAYGWRPFMPWNDRWHFIDLAFVADPWIWLGLGGILFLSKKQSQSSVLAWSALFALIVFLLLNVPIDWTIRVAWLFAGVVIIALKWRVDGGEQSARLMNRCALAGLVIYLGAMGILHAMAIYRAAEVAQTAIAPNEQVVELSALPVEGNPLKWRIVISTETAFHLGDVYLSGAGEPTLVHHRRRQGNEEAIEAALATEEARRFLKFARFPAITTFEVNRATDVEIVDLRFGGINSLFTRRIRVPMS